MWQRDVNLTLDANIKHLRKLYEHCAKSSQI